MTMVERVARAICKAEGYAQESWEVYIKQARAAIETMRPFGKEAEERSTYDDEIYLNGFLDAYSASQVWEAIIDEALK